MAVKVLDVDKQEEEIKDIQQEVSFLLSLKNCPNVTHYYSLILEGTKLWIIMEYCAGGSLRSLLKPGRLEERYVGIITRELLIALSFIHKAGVIHRDIKAANVLITKEGNVQLCDFGVAAQLTASNLKRSTMAGTPYWMAPEVILEGTSYSYKVDIWSLGITVYELVTGNPPYCDKDAKWAMLLIAKHKPPRLQSSSYLSLLKDFVAMCLDENPQERPMAEELLKSKFIRQHKNFGTGILKEIITRYLLWREKRASRDSVALGSDTLRDIDDRRLLVAEPVKWDFDLLLSADYILENDIVVDDVPVAEETPDSYPAGPDLDARVGKFNDYEPLMTFKGQEMTYTPTIKEVEAPTLSKKEVPKLFIDLFGGEDDFEPPEKPPLLSSMSSPLISNTGKNGLVPPVHLRANSFTDSPIKEIEIPSLDDVEASFPLLQNSPKVNSARERTSPSRERILNDRKPSLSHEIKEIGLFQMGVLPEGETSKAHLPKKPNLDSDSRSNSMKPLLVEQQPLLQSVNNNINHSNINHSKTNHVNSNHNTNQNSSNHAEEEDKFSDEFSIDLSKLNLDSGELPVLETNQFGYASGLLKTMTPLTEKSLEQALQDSLENDHVKQGIHSRSNNNSVSNGVSTSQKPSQPSLSQSSISRDRGASVLSVSSLDDPIVLNGFSLGNIVNNYTIEEQESEGVVAPPVLNTAVFLDNTSKSDLVSELGGMLLGFSKSLDIIQEQLNGFAD